MSSGTRRRDGPATRERLMQAAFELFPTAGFLQTTTPMLASRAGVAEGTIYRHFPGKEALLNTAYQRSLELALATVRRIEVDRVRRAPERLALAARGLVDEAVRHPGPVRLLLADGLDPFLDEASRAGRRALMDSLTQMVAMGKSDGVVRAGPADLWALVWYTLVGFAAGKVASLEWPAESAQVSLTLEAAWLAIAARERP